ncbi:MAG: site-specific integrase [Chloroflexota bacterium]
MLETYFVKPQTVDGIRGSWIGGEIERYVGWLAEQGYRPRVVVGRVPLLAAFGEFARIRGARTVEELPAHVDAFVRVRVGEHRGRGRREAANRRLATFAKEIRGPIEQMLEVVLPEFEGSGRRHLEDPFVGVMPGFFEYLVDERGLRPDTIGHYRHHLRRFAAYLVGIGIRRLDELSPALLSAFVAERAGSGLAKTSIRDTCGVLRVFLRYAHREGLIGRDLARAVEWPQVYRLSTIPRSIAWDDVGKVLGAVDRRTAAGRRDYAILLLLVTYGLRAGEVAGLTLDDIDWKRERLAVPARKAGHSTAFPLSGAVGAALVDYLKGGRPETADRHIFFRALAPVRPIGAAAVSSCAGHYLRAAGIRVPRPGSHTLRHTAVQRLVDTDFSLKTIGDFVGHRSAASTEIYAKVAVETLRAVAQGDGEEVLG